MRDLTAAQYVAISWRKVEIARRHLTELAALPQAMVIDPAGTDDSRAAAEGHTDGAVFQCYAAFDTYACGVAKHFGLTEPGKASLKRIVGSKNRRRPSPQRRCASWLTPSAP